MSALISAEHARRIQARLVAYDVEKGSRSMNKHPFCVGADAPAVSPPPDSDAARFGRALTDWGPGPGHWGPVLAFSLLTWAGIFALVLRKKA